MSSKRKAIKQIGSALLSLIITIVLIELSPYAISPILYNKSFSRSGLKQELLKKNNKNKEINNSKENKKPRKEYLGNHVIHPYLGFVGIPQDSINRFGFSGNDPITHKSGDKVNILLTGGSVANQLHSNSKEKLIEYLKENQYFKDKEINILLAALGGFKQPQQLMAVNYFISLGAEYDIVINLDGFNEVVLPFSDNLPFNVFPIYPRHWNIYARKSLNSSVQLTISKQISLKEKQEALNKLFASTFLNNSNFGLLVWDVLNTNNNSEYFELENQLRDALKSSKSNYQSTGPTEVFTDTTQFFTEQVAIWERCSLLLAGIGKHSKFEYFHFLQPNQYHNNSKELTKEELKIAYKEESFSYKTAVQKGYPILISQGKNLIYKDVNFIDLTMMFKSEKRSVYNDECCHFNKLGYDLITKKIAIGIIEHFNKKYQDSKK